MCDHKIIKDNTFDYGQYTEHKDNHKVPSKIHIQVFFSKNIKALICVALASYILYNVATVIT